MNPQNFVIKKSLALMDDMQLGVGKQEQCRSGKQITGYPMHAFAPVGAEIDLHFLDPKYRFAAVVVDSVVTYYKYTEEVGTEGIKSDIAVGHWVRLSVGNSEDAYYTRLKSFGKGNTLDYPTDALYNEADDTWYVWTGAFPKQVPPGSTPASTGSMWKSVLDTTLRTSLASPDGVANIGIGNNTLLEYLAGLPTDMVVYTEAEVAEAFKNHDHVVLRALRIEGTITVPAMKSLTVLPPLGERKNLLANSGKKFLLSRGSQFFAPSLACLDYNIDVVTLVGAERPAMILGVGRPVSAYFTVESEYRKGRGLVMDASSRDGVSGIIAGAKIVGSIKGMDTAYEEIVSRTGTETDATYINNNEIDLVIWQCRRGLIQPDYKHGTTPRVEIAANIYHINYQTDGGSEDVLNIFGVRNLVTGHVWDYDYPKLHEKSINISGTANTVGGRNFPSITGSKVFVLDPVESRNTYIGGTYGTDRQDIAPVTLFHKLFQALNTAEVATVPFNCFITKAERDVATNAAFVAQYTKTVYFRRKDKLPLSLDGYILLRNKSASSVDVRVGFGMSAAAGNACFGPTHSVAAGALLKVPLTALLTESALYATVDQSGWLGAPTIGDTVQTMNFVISLSNTGPITVCGGVLTTARYDL